MSTASGVEATYGAREEPEAGKSEGDGEPLPIAEALKGSGAEAGGPGLSKAAAEVVAEVARPLGTEAGAEVPEAEASDTIGGEAGSEVPVDSRKGEEACDTEAEGGVVSSASGEAAVEDNAGSEDDSEDGDGPRVAGGTEAGG